MAAPCDDRSRYRLFGLVGVVLVAICLVDIVMADLRPAVWMLILGWVGALVALRIRNGRLVAVGKLVPTMSGPLSLGFVALTSAGVAVVALSRAFGEERSPFQQVAAVFALGLGAGMVAISVTVLMRLPVAQPAGSADGGP